jgi:hypothetical protein
VVAAGVVAVRAGGDVLTVALSPQPASSISAATAR